MSLVWPGVDGGGVKQLPNGQEGTSWALSFRRRRRPGAENLGAMWFVEERLKHRVRVFWGCFTAPLDKWMCIGRAGASVIMAWSPWNIRLNPIKTSRLQIILDLIVFNAVKVKQSSVISSLKHRPNHSHPSPYPHHLAHQIDISQKHPISTFPHYILSIPPLWNC